MRASFVRLSDIRAGADVSEIWIYAQHLAYYREIQQLQRVSMTTAAAVMVVDTTGDGKATTLMLPKQLCCGRIIVSCL